MEAPPINPNQFQQPPAVEHQQVIPQPQHDDTVVLPPYKMSVHEVNYHDQANQYWGQPGLFSEWADNHVAMPVPQQPKKVPKTPYKISIRDLNNQDYANRLQGTGMFSDWEPNHVAMPVVAKQAEEAPVPQPLKVGREDLWVEEEQAAAAARPDRKPYRQQVADAWTKANIKAGNLLTDLEKGESRRILAAVGYTALVGTAALSYINLEYEQLGK